MAIYNWAAYAQLGSLLMTSCFQLFGALTVMKQSNSTSPDACTVLCSLKEMSDTTLHMVSIGAKRGKTGEIINWFA